MSDLLYPLRRLHGKLHEKKMLRARYDELFKAHPNSVFLVLTPEHDNIGDHGIAYAETKFLKSIGINPVEITGKKLKELNDRHLLSVLNGFPILVNGGGYLGTLWYESELLLRDLIKADKRSAVCCLPNTIYYENDRFGINAFEESKKLYHKHKRLYLYAREEQSYKIMKDAYSWVKLIPDMVLSLDPIDFDLPRHGCLLCFRSDCEKTMADEKTDSIIVQARSLFGDDVQFTDMISVSDVSVDDRKNAVFNKLREFAAAELVITDRLHGMIFCAITGTPCIVLGSKSHKVSGCYEWIKDLDYVRFAGSESCIADEYSKIPSGIHHYDNSRLKDHFDELADDILQIVKKGRIR